MKFKSQVYTQVSGSVGGVTYAHNRGGMYARARSLNVNPNTDAQQAVRDAVKILIDAWSSTLTSTQRDAWNLYAFNTPMLNKLGDLTKRSGQNMYVRANVAALQGGQTRIDDAPHVYDLGVFTPISFTADASADTLSVAFDVTDEWAINTGGLLFIYQSRPQNATRNFFKGPFQLAQVILGDTTTPPTSPVVVNSLFPLSTAQRVFVRATARMQDGRYTMEQIAHASVVP